MRSSGFKTHEMQGRSSDMLERAGSEHKQYQRCSARGHQSRTSARMKWVSACMSVLHNPCHPKFFLEPNPECQAGILAMWFANVRDRWLVEPGPLCATLKSSTVIVGMSGNLFAASKLCKLRVPTSATTHHSSKQLAYRRLCRSQRLLRAKVDRTA